MRDIQDIIKELSEHPEYIHHEVWTKQDVREYISSQWNLDETGSDKLGEILTDDDYSDFGDFVYNVYNSSFDYTEYEYEPHLEKRINRHIKLWDLLGEKKPDDDMM